MSQIIVLCDMDCDIDNSTGLIVRFQTLYKGIGVYAVNLLAIYLSIPSDYRAITFASRPIFEPTSVLTPILPWTPSKTSTSSLSLLKFTKSPSVLPGRSMIESSCDSRTHLLSQSTTNAMGPTIPMVATVSLLSCFP